MAGPRDPEVRAEEVRRLDRIARQLLVVSGEAEPARLLHARLTAKERDTCSMHQLTTALLRGRLRGEVGVAKTERGEAFYFLTPKGCLVHDGNGPFDSVLQNHG